MVEVIQASNLALYELEERFNLLQVQDYDFFPEWQGIAPDLTACIELW